MTPHIILAAVALATLLPWAVPADASHGTVFTKDYVLAGQAPAPVGCSFQGNVGSVVFCGLDHPAPAEVTVGVKDATGLLTGAFYRFANPQGATMGVGLFCSYATLAVPAGASELRVWPSIAGYFEGCYGPGTTGTVTMAWSKA